MNKRNINVTNNRLITISVAPLPSINIIRLNDNQLTDFPMGISNFPNLKTFKMNNSNPLACSNMDQSFSDIEFKCDSQN